MRKRAEDTEQIHDMKRSQKDPRSNLPFLTSVASVPDGNGQNHHGARHHY